MRSLTRRDALRLCLASLSAVPLAARASAHFQPLDAADLVTAWRKSFAGPPGLAFAWWYAGTLYAHVDGLREFPILGLNAVMICKTSASADSVILDWRTLGYFTDLERGDAATHWDNVFTGKRQAVPPRFAEGPGRYTLSTSDATLALAADNVRTNHASLTGSVTPDGVILTQIEGTLQGLPRLDGTLPSIDGRDVTERQTRLQLVLPRSETVHTNASMPRVSGFFNHVYDALPPWLGFGDRLGSVLSKGVTRRAAADGSVSPVVWKTLQRLFGAALSRDPVRRSR